MHRLAAVAKIVRLSVVLAAILVVTGSLLIPILLHLWWTPSLDRFDLA